jgi:hypothetical protein
MCCDLIACPSHVRGEWRCICRQSWWYLGCPHPSTGRIRGWWTACRRVTTVLVVGSSRHCSSLLTICLCDHLIPVPANPVFLLPHLLVLNFRPDQTASPVFDADYFLLRSRRFRTSQASQWYNNKRQSLHALDGAKWPKKSFIFCKNLHGFSPQAKWPHTAKACLSALCCALCVPVRVKVQHPSLLVLGSGKRRQGRASCLCYFVILTSSAGISRTAVDSSWNILKLSVIRIVTDGVVAQLASA